MITYVGSPTFVDGKLQPLKLICGLPESDWLNIRFSEAVKAYLKWHNADLDDPLRQHYFEDWSSKSRTLTLELAGCFQRNMIVTVDPTATR